MKKLCPLELFSIINQFQLNEKEWYYGTVAKHLSVSVTVMTSVPTQKHELFLVYLSSNDSAAQCSVVDKARR